MNKYFDEYFSVLDKKTGRVIAHCGNEFDAQMLCNLKPNERTYKKERFIMDQVIDISSTTDKQLPGQIGLPPGQYKIVDSKIYTLEESNLQVVEV
jgi:hypothetical protein